MQPVSSPTCTSLMPSEPSTASGADTHFTIKFKPFCSGWVLPTFPNFGFLNGLQASISAHFSMHAGESVSSMESQIDFEVGLCLLPYITTGSWHQSLIVFGLTPAASRSLQKLSRSAL